MNQTSENVTCTWLKGTTEVDSCMSQKYVTFGSFLQTYPHTHSQSDHVFIFDHSQSFDVREQTCSTSLLDTEPKGIVSGQSLFPPSIPLSFSLQYTQIHMGIVKGRGKAEISFSLGTNQEGTDLHLLGRCTKQNGNHEKPYWEKHYSTMYAMQFYVLVNWWKREIERGQLWQSKERNT